MSSSKYLYVTGSSGIVGQGVIPLLKVRGMTIIPIVHGENSVKKEYISFDYRSESFISNTIIPQSKILHLASIVPRSEKDRNSSDVYKKNCEIDSIIRAAADNTDSKTVYMSSISVYGYGYKDLSNCDELDTLLIGDLYAEYKAQGEELFSKKDDIVLRLSSPFGSDGRGLINTLYKMIQMKEPVQFIGSGLRTQDYVSMQEIARYIHLLLEKSASGIFNLSRGHSTSFIELLKTLEQIIEKSAVLEKITGDEAFSVSINALKIQNMTNFTPPTLQCELTSTFTL